MVHMESKEIQRRRKIGKSISTTSNLEYDIRSILELSSRTTQKILVRMWEAGILKCSNCGWDRTTCDLHHINGRDINNSNSHDNLSYLCPNCHRLAHRGLLKSIISIRVQIGDNWMNYFYGFRTRKSKDEILVDKENRDKKRLIRLKLSENRKLLVLNSGIDFSIFGWGVKLSKEFNISPQKTSLWVKKNMKDFYDLNCHKNK